MYDSGNFLSFIIIGLIVGIAVFLILREFWCWYWKINKISSQLDEQNQLLKQLLTHFGVSVVSQSLFDYVVLQNMNLRSEPNLTDSKILTILQAGNELLFLEQGDEVTIDNVTAPWFKVKNKEDIRGWCFSGRLKHK
jgi:hypothetical protein